MGICLKPGASPSLSYRVWRAPVQGEGGTSSAVRPISPMGNQEVVSVS